MYNIIMLGVLAGALGAIVVLLWIWINNLTKRFNRLEYQYNVDIQKIAAFQNEQININRALADELKEKNLIPMQYGWGEA